MGGKVTLVRPCTLHPGFYIQTNRGRENGPTAPGARRAVVVAGEDPDTLDSVVGLQVEFGRIIVSETEERSGASS